MPKTLKQPKTGGVSFQSARLKRKLAQKISQIRSYNSKIKNWLIGLGYSWTKDEGNFNERATILQKSGVRDSEAEGNENEIVPMKNEKKKTHISIDYN